MTPRAQEEATLVAAAEAEEAGEEEGVLHWSTSHSHPGAPADPWPKPAGPAIRLRRVLSTSSQRPEGIESWTSFRATRLPLTMYKRRVIGSPEPTGLSSKASMSVPIS